MTRRLALLRARGAEAAPWLAGGLVAVSVGVLGNAVHASIESWLTGQPIPRSVLWFRAGSLLAFALAVWWLYRLRRVLFAPRTRLMMTDKAPEKRGHLVIFLSNLQTDREQFVEGVPEGIRLTGHLTADLALLEEAKRKPVGPTGRGSIKWSWEQPLRGIRHHLGKLCSVTVVCSVESIRQAHWFLAILRKYAELACVKLWVAVKDGEQTGFFEAPHDLARCDGWNFEEFDDLSRAVAQVIRFLKEQGAAERQIVIDFTGGQKVTSVVAAAVTFNRQIKTQYVQTNEPYAVVSYDIVLGSGETGGLGL